MFNFLGTTHSEGTALCCEWGWMNAVKFASCHLHANDKCSTQKMPLRINLLGAELVSRRVDDYDANDIYSFFFFAMRPRSEALRKNFPERKVGRHEKRRSFNNQCQAVGATTRQPREVKLPRRRGTSGK